MATAKTIHTHTLILGGGLTGLGTAYGLEQRGFTDYLVLEANKQPGGLCSSTRLNGYQFDYGGHLLHLHTPAGKALVFQLLRGNLQKHNRQAFIYTNGMHVPYPFQQNLWALHKELRDLCVDGIKRLGTNPPSPANFEEWCLASFGYGVYEAFFRPYNEKLWGIPLRELTCEWCGPFVPAPLRQEILQSAENQPTTSIGYNSIFYYPKQGGIGALIKALADQVTHLQTNCAVIKLDLEKKTAYTSTPQTIHFEYLVNTIALPNFIDLLTGNKHLKQLAQKLQSQPVTVYHLAIARDVPHFSWIYCPDAMQPFYRVGLQSGFSADAIPTGKGSLFYIELPGLVPQTSSMEQHIWHGLHQKGIVMQDDVKLFSTWQTIPHAYVIFNQARAQVVPFLIDELQKKQVYCAGRYGRWEYSFMERSLLEGQQLAQQLSKLV